MKRLKTFLIYALIIAAVWIFSDIVIYLAINGTYKDKVTQVYVSQPQITVLESKATHINGYVKGSIRNNTQEIINDKYLKIEMYSKRDVNLGTKYVKIDNLQKDAVQDFEMWYEFTDVDYVIIRTTEDVANISESGFSSQGLRAGILFGKLMLLYFL